MSTVRDVRYTPLWKLEATLLSRYNLLRTACAPTIAHSNGFCVTFKSIVHCNPDGTPIRPRHQAPCGYILYVPCSFGELVFDLF